MASGTWYGNEASGQWVSIQAAIDWETSGSQARLKYYAGVSWQGNLSAYIFYKIPSGSTRQRVRMERSGSGFEWVLLKDTGFFEVGYGNSFSGSEETYFYWEDLTTTYSSVSGSGTIQQENFTITVVSGGNGTVSGSGTYRNGSNATIAAYPNTGYHFVRWSDGDTRNPCTFVVTGSETYTATFAPNVYTVNFDSCGGSSVASKSVTYKSTYGALTTPTRRNYEFLGWYTSASGGTKITSSTVYNRTSNQTLYAQWRLIGYDVTYYQNGGSGSYVGQKIIGADYTIEDVSSRIKRSGYFIRNYNTSADGSGTTYAIGDTYSTEAALNLYCIWERSYYKPIFITAPVVQRCLSDGTVDNEGTHCLVEFDWQLYNSNFDEDDSLDPKIIVKYKERNATSWSTAFQEQITGGLGEGSYVGHSTGADIFDTDKAYTLLIEIYDINNHFSLTGDNATSSSETFITTSYFTMDIYPTGRGFAVGQAMSEEDMTLAETEGLFDSRMNVAMKKKIYIGIEDYEEEETVDKRIYDALSNLGWVDECFSHVVNFTYHITNGSIVSGPNTAYTGVLTKIVVEANEGWLLPFNVTVSSGTKDWDSDTGILLLTDYNEDVDVTVDMAYLYKISCNIESATVTGDTQIRTDSTATLTITPVSGYYLPPTITVTNATYTYDQSTGVIVLSNPTGNVTVEAEMVVHNYLCFTAEEAGSTVAMQKSSSSAPDVSLEYSIDKETWLPFVVGSTTVTLANIGDEIYMRGINTMLSSGGGYNKFVMTGKIAASGSITSLLDNLGISTTIYSIYCYQYMFNNCTSLTTPPELPATELADYCYRYMFQNCTSLTTPPELPATELAYYCYSNMFNNCTSLTTPPELPATELAICCYNGMFQNCTSLTTPPELPATELANYCYQYMFNNCTSLTTPPELPATELANYCYSGMFQNCTSLTTPPELPATELAINCYRYMFQNCTSLKINTTGTAGTEWRIPKEGTITTVPTDALTNMLINCGGDAPATPSVNTTYYIGS